MFFLQKFVTCSVYVFLNRQYIDDTVANSKVEQSMIVQIELITFKGIFRTMPSKMALGIKCNYFHLRINLTLLVGYTKMLLLKLDSMVLECKHTLIRSSCFCFIFTNAKCRRYN